MAQDIHLTFDAEDGVEYSDVMDAAHELTEDDISEKSPVSAGAPEVGVEFSEDDGRVLHVRVEGHSGDWSKTSQNALIGAVESVDGVENGSVESGGYDD